MCMDGWLHTYTYIMIVFAEIVNNAIGCIPDLT